MAHAGIGRSGGWLVLVSSVVAAAVVPDSLVVVGLFVVEVVIPGSGKSVAPEDELPSEVSGSAGMGPQATRKATERQTRISLSVYDRRNPTQGN